MRSLAGLEDQDIDDVLEHAHRWVDALRGARVLLTGATGWFGTWLLDALVALDRECRLDLGIVAVSRDPGAFAARHAPLHAAPQIRWVRADVRSRLPVDDRFTHVVHAATDASARLNVEEPGRMRETIVAGTRHALEIAVRERARLLFVSSGAIYGAEAFDADETRGDDGSIPVLGDAYADGKREAERLVRASAVDATIARCFAFVGPHMPFGAHFAIGNFIRDALEGDRIVIRGDGTPKRSFLYASDLVVWLLTILVAGRRGRAYNVGSDETVSIAELAERCASSAARDVPVDIRGEPGPARDYVPRIARAKEELGLRVRVPLDAAIARTAAWRARTRVAEATA